MKSLGPEDPATWPDITCIPFITVSLSFGSKQVLTCSDRNNIRSVCILLGLLKQA